MSRHEVLTAAARVRRATINEELLGVYDDYDSPRATI